MALNRSTVEKVIPQHVIDDMLDFMIEHRLVRLEFKLNAITNEIDLEIFQRIDGMN